ncbi:hypothetical protein BCR33DRAFT_850602 [Rhizoclosmatium globosum]|uniref:Uncharacterized protein n=1 Tax=Rhizoclosmatium globosum TaxID=329046 RepID=A0A1Y2CBX5_9FUNG|nr:hypothetical protein BCR33DRAFT_850602 [Rhizoclosmatium globosum]|eukprot:ORY44533.1 hypothetical protein BCR33DRAFT_850602 [Rhizoclosmatium globosum]
MSVTGQLECVDAQDAFERLTQRPSDLWGQSLADLLLSGEFREEGRTISISNHINSRFHYVTGPTNPHALLNLLSKISVTGTQFKFSGKSQSSNEAVNLGKATDNKTQMRVNISSSKSVQGSERMKNMNIKLLKSVKSSYLAFKSSPHLKSLSVKSKKLVVVKSPRSYIDSAFEDFCEQMTIKDLEEAVKHHKAVAAVDRLNYHHAESLEELAAAKNILVEQLMVLEEMLELRLSERRSNYPQFEILIISDKIQLPLFLTSMKHQLLQLQNLWTRFIAQPRLFTFTLEASVLSVAIIYIARFQALSKDKSVPAFATRPIIIISPKADRWMALFRLVIPMKELQEVMGGLFALDDGISSNGAFYIHSNRDN